VALIFIQAKVETGERGERDSCRAFIGGARGNQSLGTLYGGLKRLGRSLALTVVIASTMQRSFKLWAHSPDLFAFSSARLKIEA